MTAAPPVDDALQEADIRLGRFVLRPSGRPDAAGRFRWVLLGPGSMGVVRRFTHTHPTAIAAVATEAADRSGLDLGLGRAILTPTKTGATMGRDPEPPTRAAARAPKASVEPRHTELRAGPWHARGTIKWCRARLDGVLPQALVCVVKVPSGVCWAPGVGSANEQRSRDAADLAEAYAQADAYLISKGYTLDGDAPGDRAPAADPAHLEEVRRPPDPAPSVAGSAWWPGSPLGGPDVRGVRASRWKPLGGLGGRGWGHKGWRRCLGTRQIVDIRIHEDRAVWLAHLGSDCFELNGGSAIPHTFHFGDDARAAVRAAFEDADAYLVRLGMVLTGDLPDIDALVPQPEGVVDSFVAELKKSRAPVTADPAPPPARTPVSAVVDLQAELQARLDALRALEDIPAGVEGVRGVQLLGNDGEVRDALWAEDGALFDEVIAAIGAVFERRRSELLARASRGIL